MFRRRKYLRAARVRVRPCSEPDSPELCSREWCSNHGTVRSSAAVRHKLTLTRRSITQCSNSHLLPCGLKYPARWIEMSPPGQPHGETLGTGAGMKVVAEHKALSGQHYILNARRLRDFYEMRSRRRFLNGGVGPGMTGSYGGSAWLRFRGGHEPMRRPLRNDSAGWVLYLEVACNLALNRTLAYPP
jgi:hypothetical protein